MCQRITPVRMSCYRAEQSPWKAKMCSACSVRSKELIALLQKFICAQSLASIASPMPGHVPGWVQETPRGRGTCEAARTPFPSRQPAESALLTLFLSTPPQRELLLSSPKPKPPTESNATSAVMVRHQTMEVLTSGTGSTHIKS